MAFARFFPAIAFAVCSGDCFLPRSLADRFSIASGESFLPVLASFCLRRHSSERGGHFLPRREATLFAMVSGDCFCPRFIAANCSKSIGKGVPELSIMLYPIQFTIFPNIEWHLFDNFHKRGQSARTQRSKPVAFVSVLMSDFRHMLIQSPRRIISLANIANLQRLWISEQIDKCGNRCKVARGIILGYHVHTVEVPFNRHASGCLTSAGAPSLPPHFTTNLTNCHDAPQRRFVLFIS